MCCGQNEALSHLVHKVALNLKHSFVNLTPVFQEYWSHTFHGHSGESDHHTSGEQEHNNEAFQRVLDRFEHLWLSVGHQEIRGGQIQEELRAGH